mmetsp:Transcript_15875/g.20002  ORF Transcript_15875/g.20002 Transcript_15875/m.20002 type:complete len:301 (-) Transcript_15875:344-1246(-)
MLKRSQNLLSQTLLLKLDEDDWDGSDCLVMEAGAEALSQNTDRSDCKLRYSSVGITRKLLEYIKESGVVTWGQLWHVSSLDHLVELQLFVTPFLNGECFGGPCRSERVKDLLGRRYVENVYFLLLLALLGVDCIIDGGLPCRLLLSARFALELFFLGLNRLEVFLELHFLRLFHLLNKWVHARFSQVLEHSLVAVHALGAQSRGRCIHRCLNLLKELCRAKPLDAISRHQRRQKLHRCQRNLWLVRLDLGMDDVDSFFAEVFGDLEEEKQAIECLLLQRGLRCSHTLLDNGRDDRIVKAS